MANQTVQLFDSMFKDIIKKASSPAVVRFINGLFGKKYKPNSKIEFLPGTSGIRLSVNGDYYLIETQVSEDLEIILRVFQYIYAKSTSKNGLLIELALPAPKIIYFENAGKAPDFITVHITYPKGEFSYKTTPFKALDYPISEFEKKHLDLLLPFYLLKFRRELQKKNIGSEKRKEIANQMAASIADIERILKNHKKKKLISKKDVELILCELARAQKAIAAPRSKL